MKQTCVNLFHETAATQLKRPWKKYRDGTLFYGLTKAGSKRHALTTKQGNKTFYKGTRASGVGSHTKFGEYVINWSKVRTYVAPAKETWNKELSPLIRETVPEVRNSFAGFKGPSDPKLYLKKLNEYIVYGPQETEDHVINDRNVERG
ncbi:mitochondrial 54S ribosomal protein YmL27 [Saccharomycopsis crataegensis]|uniref:Mitochondrial 54S ribosomal protein YmL27 n=1 Tax=Saccharomycopsis crataegensis TaxID=43959 RepID=A0AAV5QF12_9ASCO|nr:mitochondrial 54S ribosomal protein YmL27 [Saccharomycopsis crataegensis]